MLYPRIFLNRMYSGVILHQLVVSLLYPPVVCRGWLLECCWNVVSYCCALVVCLHAEWVWHVVRRCRSLLVGPTTPLNLKRCNSVYTGRTPFQKRTDKINTPDVSGVHRIPETNRLTGYPTPESIMHETVELYFIISPGL